MKATIYLLVTILLVTAHSTTQAQIIDDYQTDAQGKVIISKVYTVDSTLSQRELYLRAKQFMTGYWRNAKEVTQVDDKEDGILSTSGYAEISTNFGLYKCYYTLSVYVKDGKYKTDISNIRFQSYASQYVPNPREEYAEKIFSKEYYYKDNGKVRDRAHSFKVHLDLLVKTTQIELQKAMSAAPSTEW